MPSEERVLCFERKHLEELGLFQGLNPDVNKYFALVNNSSELTYRLRSEAETDKRYKQIIPYVVILWNDHILHYRRGSGGGETRLHGKYSIGIGGHISDEDHGFFSEGACGYFDGMRRELKEEVDIDPVDESMVAVINDDSTEVGYVQFGVVHIMHVASDKIVGNRKGILAPEFAPIADAVRKSDQYESWSRLCLENMDLLLKKAALQNAAS